MVVLKKIIILTFMISLLSVIISALSAFSMF